jgi:5-methyltetrahydropteroyltriglutamate--homocysteine methyltransferase
MSATFPTGTILGYPRIGRRRELKKAVEAFWAGKISVEELEATAASLRAATRERLASLGLGRTDSSIPEAFSYYDQVLDAAVTVGAVPTRFERLVKADGTVDLAGYFTIARGEGADTPAEMTKWFDSNYHYLVPEIGPETNLHLASDRLVREVAEATVSGFRTRPVIVGPVTFLLLSKASEGAPEGYLPLDRLDDLLPVYAELIAALTAAGAEWVQLDEPALVSESIDVPRDVVLAATKRRARTPEHLRRRALRLARRRPAGAARHPRRRDRPRPREGRPALRSQHRQGARRRRHRRPQHLAR